MHDHKNAELHKVTTENDVRPGYEYIIFVVSLCTLAYNQESECDGTYVVSDSEDPAACPV